MKIIETAKNTPEIERLQNALTELSAVITKIVTERVDQALAQKSPAKFLSNNSGNIPIENEKIAADVKEPLLHDKRSAAARLSISPMTVHRLIQRGEIRRVPHLRKVLIAESELQRFAAS